MLLTLLPLIATAHAEPAEAAEVLAEETAELKLSPRPLQLQATLPVPPAMPFRPGVLPAIGMAPVETVPYTLNIAAGSLQKTGWERALYPHQLDAPFPGFDESPLRMVTQGLQAIPNKHSSFQVPDEQ